MGIERQDCYVAYCNGKKCKTVRFVDNEENWRYACPVVLGKVLEEMGWRRIGKNRWICPICQKKGEKDGD